MTYNSGAFTKMQIHPAPLLTSWQHNLAANPTSNIGTTLTSPATPHTKPATFTDLIATTTYDSYGFWLAACGTNASAAVTGVLLDIAIGGSGSEVIIAPDIQCGWRDNPSGNALATYFPLFIPKGSRLSG